MAKSSNNTRNAPVGGAVTTMSNAVANRVSANANQLAWTRNVSDSDLRRGISQNLRNGDTVTVRMRYEGRSQDRGFIEAQYTNNATRQTELVASSYWQSHPTAFGQTKEEAMEQIRDFVRRNILDRQ